MTHTKTPSEEANRVTRLLPCGTLTMSLFAAVWLQFATKVIAFLRYMFVYTVTYLL